jgi:DNA-directed RNA polymerase subunit M/transcription elongation factor TFIIS
MFTKQQKDLYIKDPTVCPYCGNNRLYFQSAKNNLSEHKGYNKMVCKDCGKCWEEVLSLIDIREVE